MVHKSAPKQYGLKMQIIGKQNDSRTNVRFIKIKIFLYIFS